MSRKKVRLCEDCGADIRLRGKLAILCKACAKKRSDKCVKRYYKNKSMNKKERKKKAIYQKELARKQRCVVDFFKSKYRCRTTTELYEMIENNAFQKIN